MFSVCGDVDGGVEVSLRGKCWRIFAILGLCGLFLAMVPGIGQAWLDYEAHFAGRYGDIEGDTEIESGFAEAAFNLGLEADLLDDLAGKMEVEISEAEEIEVEELYVDQASILGGMDLRVGRFDINYGKQPERRTDNADGEDNPVVGNALVDPVDIQTGAEISGIYGFTGWSASVTTGREGAEFDEGRGDAFTGKLWRRLFRDLKGAVSFYHYDGREEGVGTEFTASEPGQEIYEDFGVSPYSIGDNSYVQAYQTDLVHEMEPLNRAVEVNGFIGRKELDEDEVDYWSAGGRIEVDNFTDLGFRHGQLAREEDGRLERTQVGVVREINPLTRVKLEYVDQSGDVSGGNGHEFDGIIGELGVSW